MGILIILFISLIIYVYIMWCLVQFFGKRTAENRMHSQKFLCPYSVILVFGAGINGNKPSKELQSRLDVALQFWEQNTDSWVFLSGGVNSEDNEPNVMVQYLRLKGIPEANLRILNSSFNTRETMSSFKNIMGEIPPGNLLAVSSPYHSFRIKTEARRHKLILELVSDKYSPEHMHKHISRIRSLTEVLAITFYLLPHSFTKRVPTNSHTLRHKIPKMLIRLGS
ncbi:MAG: YdcF family protein [Candidatus Planktophila sp.]